MSLLADIHTAGHAQSRVAVVSFSKLRRLFVRRYMGRVRRYKKIKAIDPYAKKQKAEIDTVHDEPPEEYQERGEVFLLTSLSPHFV